MCWHGAVPSEQLVCCRCVFVQVWARLHSPVDLALLSLRLQLQFYVDAATPCAVMVFYGVTTVDEAGLLALVSSPVTYGTTRFVLPAGSHQLVTQSVFPEDGLDLRMFPQAVMFPSSTLPWAARTSYPVMVVLESVGA